MTIFPIIFVKYFKKKVQIYVPKKIILFLTKNVGFFDQMDVFNPHKTLRVLSGFNSQVRVWPGFMLKSRVRARVSESRDQVGFLSGF